MNNENTFTKSQIRILMAIASLLLALVLLGASTYAWFTVSTAPEVQQIKVQLSATNNFEIAIFDSAKPEGPDPVSYQEVSGTDDYRTWGQLVVFDTTNATEGIKLPAKVEGDNISTVQFDATSKRTSGLVSATEKYEGLGPGFYVSPDNYNCAAVYKVWLRTNTPGEVSAKFEVTSSNENKLANALGVSMIVGADSHTGGASAGTYTLNPSEGGISDATLDLGSFSASDDGTLVKIIVYMDGEKVKATQVAGKSNNEIMEGLTMNIHFTNSNVQQENNH